MSLEMCGQTFKVKILCVLSSHVQPLGRRLGVGVELSLTRAELLPNECNGATEGQERDENIGSWSLSWRGRQSSCDVEMG